MILIIHVPLFQEVDIAAPVADVGVDGALVDATSAAIKQAQCE